MKKLVSGMILVTKDHGDLHYYISTPIGDRIIDVNGFCEEFDQSKYAKAYLPKDYNDNWVPDEDTIIILEE